MTNMGTRFARLFAAACIFLQAGTLVCAADLRIIDKKGTATLVKDGCIYQGPISGCESKGLPIRQGKGTTVVAWNRIKEVSVLYPEKKSDDSNGYPAKLLMQDGKTLEADIVSNSSSGSVKGKTELGDYSISLGDVDKLVPSGNAHPPSTQSGHPSTAKKTSDTKQAKELQKPSQNRSATSEDLVKLCTQIKNSTTAPAAPGGPLYGKDPAEMAAILKKCVELKQQGRLDP